MASKKATAKAATHKRYRDTVTGQIVTQAYAQANSATTVAETVHPIVSSNLESASYDETTSELTVTFKGGRTHKYPDFPQELWKEFQKLFDGKLGSAGKFFQANIKDLPNERLGE